MWRDLVRRANRELRGAQLRGGVSFKKSAHEQLSRDGRLTFVWSAFPQDSPYFGRSEKAYVRNFRAA